MRRLIMGFAGFLLLAAAPADEARQLMEAGKEKAAFELVQGAAEKNDIEAINYLAWFYDEGRYVEKDYAKAAILYRRAAEGGQRYAQWRLGVMLDMGEGLKSNPKEAVLWFRKAAAKGSPLAHTSLAVMYATGRGVQKDFAEARKLYVQAARLGEVHGFYGVAILHARGEGVKKDMIEACAWMIIAASQGDKQATGSIERGLCEKGDPIAGANRANEIAKEFGLDSRFEFEPKKPELNGATPAAA